MNLKTLLVALNAQYIHKSLSLATLVAACPEVEPYEAHINLPFRRILEDILRQEPEAVGFSTYVWNARLVFRLCRALKAARPALILFVGGPEVSPIPEATLSRHDALDYVLFGEGEAVLPAFLRALERGETPNSVPGVAWRGGRSAEPEPLSPADWPDVWAKGIDGLTERILYLETARGCPFRCRYCLSGQAGRVRALPAQEAVRRLTFLADRGARLIKLVDRTFNYDETRATAIWRGLIDHAAGLSKKPTYHFEIAAHLLTRRSFDVLQEAPQGLFQFEAGIQSTSEATLSAIDRPVGFAQLRDNLRDIVRLGTIHLHVDLIAGLPEETPSSFAQSFNDAYGIGAQRLQLGFLKVLPGSALSADAGALGLRFEPDPPYEILETPAMPLSALLHLKDVERLTDWYQNSERYPLTLRYLMQANTPYALFSGLAERFRARGVFDRDLDEQGRATALLEACDSPALRALLTHDLLRCGLRRKLPALLAFSEDDALRATLRASFHPVRGQSAARYDWDVLAFERGEPLVKRAIEVIYPAAP